MKKTQRLAVSGILIALAIVLSLIKVYQLPFGGSVTAFSMVPVMLAAYLYGVRWGMLCGLADGILQAVLGAATTQAFAGLGLWEAVAMVCMDYLLAFSALGLAGLFRKAARKPSLAFGLGCAAAGLVRFLFHTASGAILYGSWAEWYFTQPGFFSWGATVLERFSGTGLAILYSCVYNGSYMLPETVLAVAAGSALLCVPPIRKAAHL